MIGFLAVIAFIAVVAPGKTPAPAGHHSAPNRPGPTVLSERHAHVRPPRQQLTSAAVIDRVLAYTSFVRSGGARRRDIALTFDDGPGPYTADVLAMLRRTHAPATFFAVGRMERYFGSVTVAEAAAGDVVGDHTETHPFMPRLSALDQDRQIVAQAEQLRRLGVPYPRLFRPPYGSFDTTTLALLRRHHMLMVLWSTDTADFSQPGTVAIIRRALAGAKPGAIILMHDGGGRRTQTIAALPAIVHTLRARGYRLVTVPQLLADDPPLRGQQLAARVAGD